MVVITGSSDVSLLKIRYTFDFSLSAPTLKATNESEGAHLSSCKIGFRVTSPSGNLFYDSGDSSTWTILGNFTEFTFPVLPTFKGIVEFSGNPYIIEVTIKDSSNRKTSDTARGLINAFHGNANSSKHYGGCLTDISIDCNKGLAFIKDITNYTYQGKTGSFISKKITVIAPPDADGTTPAAIDYLGTSLVQHALLSSGKGFKAVVISVLQYVLPDNTFLIGKYIGSTPFDVNCNYDLCPLICDIDKYINTYDKCDKDKEEKLLLINSKLLMAVTAMVRPACGVDVGKLIEEIKEIGGFGCDCSANNQYGFNSSGSTGGAINYQFDTCGDITASASAVGSNVTFSIKDTRYIFTNHPTSGSAFTFTNNLVGCNRTVLLKVDEKVLAGELLAIIKSDADLANLFNSIVLSAGLKLTVNGKCIVTTTPLSDYYLTINNFPGSSSPFAIFKSITIDEVVHSMSFAVNGGNIAQLQTALNALNLGTFTCVFSNGIITITSLNNTHIINGAVITNAGVVDDRQMVITKDTHTLPAQDPNKIIQAIIDYLCGINTDQVYLGHDFQLTKTTKNSDGTNQKFVFTPKSTLWEVLQALGSNQTDIISLVASSGISDCKSILDKFDFILDVLLKQEDYVIGSKNGKCAKLTIKDIAEVVWNKIKTDADFCLSVKACASATTCTVVQNFTVEVQHIPVNVPCNAPTNLTVVNI